MADLEQKSQRYLTEAPCVPTDFLKIFSDEELVSDNVPQEKQILIVEFFKQYLDTNFRYTPKPLPNGIDVREEIIKLFANTRSISHMYFMIETFHRAAMCNFPGYAVKMSQILVSEYLLNDHSRAYFPHPRVLLGMFIYLSVISIDTYLFNTKFQTEGHAGPYFPSTYVAGTEDFNYLTPNRISRTGLYVYEPEPIDWEIYSMMQDLGIIQFGYKLVDLIGQQASFRFDPRNMTNTINWANDYFRPVRSYGAGHILERSLLQIAQMLINYFDLPDNFFAERTEISEQ